MKMQETVSAVIFEGGEAAGEVEEMMVKVRHAVLLDNIEKMKQVEPLTPLYLLTNYEQLAEAAESAGANIVENNVQEEEFHFGKVLQKLINTEKLQNIFYMGGASIPLVSVEELKEICSQLLSSSSVIYANNVQSADIIAFTPASLVNNINLPGQDNILAVTLRDSTGVPMKLFRHTLGFLFDLDTPADLLVLAGSPWVGPQTRKQLGRLNLDLHSLGRAKEVLKGDYQEVLLLGRVGAPLVAHINKNLKVRLRIFSEERGMKALGREQSGDAISLMGYFLEEVGTHRFIRYLEKVAECAFLDTRVIMAHFNLNPSAEERFLSDLGRWEEIKTPLLKDLTRAVKESHIPIICGGHSLVLGGLWALVDEIGPTHPFGDM